MIKEASFRDLGRVPAGRIPKERILRGSLPAQALKLDGRRVLNQSTRMGGISRKLRKVRPLNSGPPWSPHENQMLTLREIEAIGLGAHAALVGRAHGYGLVAAGGAGVGPGVGPALKILRGDAAALFTSWAVQPLRICPSNLHTSMLEDIRR